MTKDEARIILLEDALRQAQHTVAFLHGCLTQPDNGEMKGGYRYAYPEHTQRRLEEWAKLAPPLPSCFHSGQHLNCESCIAHGATRYYMREAKSVLSLKE